MLTQFVWRPLGVAGLGLLFSLGWHPPAAGESPQISGYWLPESGNSLLQIEANNTGLSVVLRGVLPPANPAARTLRTDENNPDTALRDRPLQGIELGVVRPEADGTYRGSIYDPESGDTYSVRLTVLNSDLLELRGYVGVPLFGRTQHWLSQAAFMRRQQELLTESGVPVRAATSEGDLCAR